MHVRMCVQCVQYAPCLALHRCSVSVRDQGAHVYACVAGACVYECHMLHVFCKVSHSINAPMACSCRFIEWAKSGVWGGAAVPLKDRWAAASSANRVAKPGADRDPPCAHAIEGL